MCIKRFENYWIYVRPEEALSIILLLTSVIKLFVEETRSVVSGSISIPSLCLPARLLQRLFANVAAEEGYVLANIATPTFSSTSLIYGRKRTESGLNFVEAPGDNFQPISPLIGTSLYLLIGNRGVLCLLVSRSSPQTWLNAKEHSGGGKTVITGLMIRYLLLINSLLCAKFSPRGTHYREVHFCSPDRNFKEMALQVMLKESRSLNSIQYIIVGSTSLLHILCQVCYTRGVTAVVE